MEKENKTSLEKTSGNKVEQKKKKKISSTPVEEIRWNPDGLYKENPYYIRIALRFRVLKYIAIAFALVFAMFMMTVFGSDITAENFQYLLKDLDFSGLTSTGAYDSLVYNGGSDSKFGIYRTEFVVVNSGQTSLYTSDGASAFYKTNNFYTPSLITSDKYFLIYDRGNTTNSYSVYNSFAELKTEKLEYPISNAAMCDEGSYVIVTKDDTYRSVVFIYNSDFKIVTEVKKDKYVTAVDIQENGKEVLIASVYDEGGDFVAELSTISPGASAVSSQITVKGAFPLSVKYFDNGNISVLFSDRFVVYTSDLKPISTVLFDAENSVSAKLSDRYCCVVFSDTLVGNDKTVKLYNSSGELVYSASASGELQKFGFYEDYTYLLFETKLIRIDPIASRVDEEGIDPNAIDIVFSASGLPIVCYAGSAKPVHFQK